MPSLGLIEPIAKNMKAVLAVQLPLARVRVEADLGLAAGLIADVAAITLGPRSNHAKYPVVEIDSVQHGVETDAPNYMKSAFTIALTAIVTAPANATQTTDPEEDLTLLTWRMERIIVDALMAGRAANAFVSGGIGYGVDFQGENIDYSPTRFIAADLFARDIFIPVLCTIEEVRT